MALNFKIRLYSVEADVGPPELLSSFFCHSGDTYADLHTRLENGGCVEWPFLFWDLQDECRILKRFETMNPVTDRVYVIPALEGDGRPQKRCRVGDQAETTSNDLAANFKRLSSKPRQTSRARSRDVSLLFSLYESAFFLLSRSRIVQHVMDEKLRSAPMKDLSAVELQTLHNILQDGWGRAQIQVPRGARVQQNNRNWVTPSHRPL